MKRTLLTAAIAVSLTASAQNSTAYNIIEGGKALVDLIRVFKIPKLALAQTMFTPHVDSCSVKGTSNFCVKNNTAKPLFVTLYRRNGNLYEAAVLTMQILPKNEECLYEIRSGVYKMKLETEEDEDKKTFREGEIQLNACSNPVENIKDPG